MLSHQFVTYEGFHTRLAITKTHKGPQRDEIVIVAAKTCAYGFEKGERYLVYAHADGNDGFSTTYCERNAPLAEAKGDIASFGGTPASAAAQPIVVLTPRLLEWTSSPTKQWLRVVALLLASM